MPVFAIPFYNELMLTRSEEDANFVLLQSLQSGTSKVVDLLSAPDLPGNDPLLPDIKTLAHQFGCFVKKIFEDGFYNGLESAWSLLKRSVVGSYHQLSAKHLDAYIDEFEFRFNNRENPFLFRDTLIRLVAGDVLTYRELVATD